ncbi:DUF1292 domain-containing protein [Aneurinibacillus sp. Ricciae_BoGa-3]|uniref:DUF1292 domain-containing protein n=1 Tax=Aneurinibacillus sp. Ricciae_BoGa-3 TaxID=3022697 RepID=UPI0023423D71|nr:DUF1292 domain-containing protein [Aneurinibacillus sp. Ricciae_BoGa-3]WCK55248.1 DUF1292 domain-containing protein [Aneurinibacillus sp. Ricciae_BoGa-3]
MNHDEVRDYITVIDNEGAEKEFAVEAMFTMEDKSYALLSSGDETIAMRITGEGEDQQLVGISDPEELDAILSAYQIAVEAEPAELQ